ncbi:MAG: MarR family transcriptional regulator [Ignavibacteria bacterium]|nr:MarR family transcriptional regulator [Ignavibacteria bacterium]
MKLEEEIKQKNFKSEYQKLIVNLIYTGNWLNARNAEFLKPYGITIQQYNILRILKGQYPEPATVNLLIDRMLDKMSNASRIVDKLLAKKLAERKVSTGDRRCVDVVITDKGLKLLDKIDETLRKWEDQFKVINLNDVKKINNILDRLRG